MRRRVALPRNYELQSGGNWQKVTSFEVATGKIGRFRKTVPTMLPADSTKAFHIQRKLYQPPLHRLGPYYHCGLLSIL